MRIGLQVPNFTWPEGTDALPGTLQEIAQIADDGGFASLWVMDHFFQIPPVGPAETDMLEGYGTLHWLAGITRRIKLGTLVTGVTYRHPGLLVKTVTTLDVLSSGRAILGIGAAWFDREHHGLGVPYPPLGERFERLEETLQIAEQMWSDEDGPFDGHHYQLAETLCVPQPVQRPRPPILVGGMGEQKTLRLVALYADACNLFTYMGMDVLVHKLDVLRDHCDAVERDFDEIERTSLSTIQMGPDHMSIPDVIAHFRELSDAGIQHAIVNLPDVHELSPLETLAKEVIPAVGGF
ncbi:MAG: LLM class F420-dependent oxidoreductase [Deltaproteobacteria bacterium]|jgi:F420-dependent oxidoreductase-like protein|nr:LLM class F420-dependent oxidoreductase [Deltaproteobacteria bacterium]